MAALEIAIGVMVLACLMDWYTRNRKAKEEEPEDFEDQYWSVILGQPIWERLWNKAKTIVLIVQGKGVMYRMVFLTGVELASVHDKTLVSECVFMKEEPKMVEVEEFIKRFGADGD